jgi:glutathione-regulated potassium-efflux system ancillary protein KefF
VIAVLYAHPYPRHSRAGAALLAAFDGLAGVDVRSLYDRYPDYDVDAAAERAALASARLVVWMHPLYWYSVPALLKHWFDSVLVKGWAYGEGGDALKGKDCLWVTTTGGDDAAFAPAGRHGHDFEAFAPAIEQTARYCGMNWLEPFVVHGAHVVADDVLRAAAARLRERLLPYASPREAGP